jgi:hypothetical protein
MKINFIGDSHVACIRSAWKGMQAQYRDVSIAFHGATGNLFQYLVLDGDKLRPENRLLAHSLLAISGVSEIETAGYDAFCLVGLQYSLQNIDLNLYAAYRTIFHAQDYAKFLVSESCFETAFKGLLRESLALSIAAIIRSVSDAPIYIVPQPMPSEGIKAGPRWQVMLDSGDDERLGNQFNAISREFARDDLRFILQDPATLSRPTTTLGRYATGSQRLDVDERHPDGEFYHMNVEYGEVALHRVLGEVLQTGTGSGPIGNSLA